VKRLGAPDLPYIIPVLQQALQINPGLQILANPWSPPGWMKANDALDNINDQGTLLASAYSPFAPVTFAVNSNGHYFTYTLPATAMTTFVWG
jgi:O-glycosyl hydrolase